MAVRVLLRPPAGEPLARDIGGGRWQEPTGEPDEVLGAGMWALPGLVDAHSHIPKAALDLAPTSEEGAETRAREALAAGVMLLIDKGWIDETAVSLVDRLPAAERPDIEAAVRLVSVPGGYLPGVALELEADDLDAVVADQARRGLGWVKLIGDWPRPGLGPVANFREEELRWAVQLAGANGARVAIHTMARDVPSMAVRAGVQSIEHGLFLTADDVDALGARGGIWVPTILRVEHTISQLGAESSGGRLLTQGLRNVRDLMGVAIEAGVYLLTGTDLMGTPARVASEALKLLDYGLPPGRVVEAVSSAGLRATDRPFAFDVGAPADAALFSADPAAEPAVLASPALVIRHGRVV